MQVSKEHWNQLQHLNHFPEMSCYICYPALERKDVEVSVGAENLYSENVQRKVVLLQNYISSYYEAILFLSSLIPYFSSFFL